MRPHGGGMRVLRDTRTAAQRERLLRTLDEAEQLGREPCWCCAACGSRITHREQSIEVGGEHVHRYTNPAGVRYVIGCFHEAPGCTAVGEPTGEWTWFPPYRWQVAVCTECGLHLGWRYTATDEFFGLILDRLIECGGQLC
jgi:hypothetical protein